MEKILCSACLLGIKCRYDGQAKVNENIIRLARVFFLVPVCPEQLGGLSTPREISEIQGKRIITITGKDVTLNFLKGAKEVLKIAQILNIKKAILKQYSPSCGCGKIYNGTFTGKIIQGNGITTKLLLKNGIEVISDEDLNELR